MFHLWMLVFLYHACSVDIYSSNYESKEPSAPSYNSSGDRSQLQHIVISVDPIIPEAVMVNLGRQERSEEQDNQHSYLRDLCCFITTTCNAPVWQCRNEINFIGEACSLAGNGCGRSLVMGCQLPRDACSCIASNMTSAVCCINQSHGAIPSRSMNNTFDDISRVAPATIHDESSCISNKCCYFSGDLNCDVLTGCRHYPSEPDVYCYIKDNNNCLKTICCAPCYAPCFCVSAPILMCFLTSIRSNSRPIL